jgi:hypothetical protein
MPNLGFIHDNPVKHGYVASPMDWPYHLFHRLGTMGLVYRWVGDERARIDCRY